VGSRRERVEVRFLWKNGRGLSTLKAACMLRAKNDPTKMSKRPKRASFALTILAVVQVPRVAQPGLVLVTPVVNHPHVSAARKGRGR